MVTNSGHIVIGVADAMLVIYEAKRLGGKGAPNTLAAPEFRLFSDFRKPYKGDEIIRTYSLFDRELLAIRRVACACLA